MAEEDFMSQIADQYNKAIDPTTKKEDLFQPEIVDEFGDEETNIDEAPVVTEDKKEVIAEEKKEEEKKEDKEELDEVDTILQELGLGKLEENKTIESVTTPEVQNSSLNIESVIKEKTGGAFSSVEDMIERLNQNPFASERIKKLNDLEKSGVDIMKVLEFEKMDIENLDPNNHNQALELIRTKLKQDEPGITDREINLELRSYMYNEDVDSDDDIEIKKVKALREAKKAKQDLIKTKQDLEIPRSQPVNNTNNNAEQQAEYNRLKAQWEQEVDSILSQYTTEKINVGTTTLEFQVKDDARNAVAKEIKNPNDFWKGYTNSSGVVDYDRLKTDMLLIKQKDAILKTVWDQGMAHGAREFGSKLKNSRQRGETQSVKTFIPEEVQIFNQLQGKLKK